MSDPSKSLWQRTKDLARRAGEEARTVSLHETEANADPPADAPFESIAESNQNDFETIDEEHEETGEDSTGS